MDNRKQSIIDALADFLGVHQGRRRGGLAHGDKDLVFGQPRKRKKHHKTELAVQHAGGSTS